MKKSKYNKELCRFAIAGVQFSDWQKADQKALVPDARLDAFHEKHNSYDSKAIRIEFNGIKLGYVPRGPIYGQDIQSMLHTLVTQGIKPLFLLAARNNNNPTWALFTVKVMVPESVDINSLQMSSWDEDDSWEDPNESFGED